jgi:hypothetical protein
VLTESSYYQRLSFESPLDIKLWADSLARPLLFIGYSLTDINLRYLLYKLDQQWQVSNLARVRPKSYIFLTAPNPVQEVIWSGAAFRRSSPRTTTPAWACPGFSRTCSQKAATCRLGFPVGNGLPCCN